MFWLINFSHFCFASILLETKTNIQMLHYLYTLCTYVYTVLKHLGRTDSKIAQPKGHENMKSPMKWIYQISLALPSGYIGHTAFRTKERECRWRGHLRKWGHFKCKALNLSNTFIGVLKYMHLKAIWIHKQLQLHRYTYI